MALIEADMLNF